MSEEEEIYISEDDIREEMIKEWCGKVKIHKSNEPTPILLLDLETPLNNSETLKKFQNKISEVLSRRLSNASDESVIKDKRCDSDDWS